MIDSFTQLLDKAWIGTVIAALGIIVAIVLYRASIIGARPVYSRRSFRVIGFNKNEYMQDVEILYRGKHVDRLTPLQYNLLEFWQENTLRIRYRRR
jgi:hypothetical protein